MNKSYMIQEEQNPGLKPYDLTNYEGVKNINFFLEDNLLKRIFLKEAIYNSYSEEHINAVWKHLSGFGEVAGSILNELAIIAHREENLGKIVNYNRSGDRIDEVEYCYEQKEIRRICYEWGLVNLDFHSDWKFPFTMFHKMALAYISNINGEAGVNCPLAMTDGMIQVLNAIGKKSQIERYLPLIAHPESSSHFMCGQFVTERVGGSNVSANRTIARKISDGDLENPAIYALIGEKWFCSNPGDLWVTTAKIEGTNTIGLFLVPKFLPDGKRNSYHLLRKKDIIGSKGKLTAEAIYNYTYAEELGKPVYGLANLIKYVINISRIHVGISACGMSRRAIMESYIYAKTRKAYGKNIFDFLQTKLEFIKMILKHTVITLANFQNFSLLEKGDSLSELLTPMLKYISTITATSNIKQVILFHGGNGILNDFSILPRLLNDAIINETWEGAHPVIQDHTIKAFKKSKIQQRLEKEFNTLRENVSDDNPYLIHFWKLWNNFKNNFNIFLKNEDLLYLNKSYIVEQLFYIYGYYLLLKEANFFVREDQFLETYKVLLNGSNTEIKSISYKEWIIYLSKENQIFLDLLSLYKELENIFNYTKPILENNSMLLSEKIDSIIFYMGVTMQGNNR